MKVQVFNEPMLLFANGQTLQDPRDGLTFFGPPNSTENEKQGQTVSWSIVGPQKGIEAFIDFIRLLESPIPTSEGLNPKIWPAYPGFEAAFHKKLSNSPLHKMILSDEKLTELATLNDQSARVGSVVDLYLNQINEIDRRDERPSIIICLTPDIVDLNCRPQSKVAAGHGDKISKKEKISRQAGQINLFEDYKAEHYEFSPDYRRQLKARALDLNIPIQIILESTVTAIDQAQSKEAGKTPLTDRAWNISTTLYYKSGGKPWQLASIRDGVCYVGLTFKRTLESETSLSACCAAQMFLKDGDGIVFKGEEGKWYSPEDKTFHLTTEAAQNLLTGVLESYNKQYSNSKPLKEVFVHCHSELGDEEIKGFIKACPPDAKLVVIRARQARNDVRLYRDGTRPVLRGTFAELNEKTAYLWTSGFKPRLGVYDGWETPAPLKISILYGEANIEQVSQDIFALTKLNYNTCRLGESNPVTISFAGAIGDILVANKKAKARPQIKFYI